MIGPFNYNVCSNCGSKEMSGSHCSQCGRNQSTFVLSFDKNNTNNNKDETDGRGDGSLNKRNQKKGGLVIKDSSPKISI